MTKSSIQIIIINSFACEFQIQETAYLSTLTTNEKPIRGFVFFQNKLKIILNSWHSDFDC